MAADTLRFSRTLALSALTVACVLASGAGLAAERPRPSLLLVTIDTVRADHLSLYGYDRATSPRLERLASRGVFFETAVTPIPLTGPAHASLLTGRWPSSLGLHENGAPLEAGPATLAEVTARAGYDTAAFISGFPLTKGVCGLARGFSSYDDEMLDARGQHRAMRRRGAKTTDAVLRWLDGRQGGKPFFLWVHYFDPHGDYSPGGAYETMFQGGPRGPDLAVALIPPYQRLFHGTDAAEYIARYDGTLRCVDDQIGRVLDDLEARGLLRQTVVVVIGDHGENLVEHNYYFDHGHELYTEAVRVPLVMAGPGVPSDGRRIRGIARTLDVMPTVLKLLGLPAPAEVEGKSLAPALASSTVMPPREAVSEACLGSVKDATERVDATPKLSVRDRRFTVLWRVASGKLELYDRSNDPGETHELLSGPRQGPTSDALRSALLARLTVALGPKLRLGIPDGAIIEPGLRARIERWLDGERK